VPVNFTAKGTLTVALLERHFHATRPQEVLGLHTTSAHNTSLWGAIEVDFHGTGGNTPEANAAAILGWYAKLVLLGFSPLLTDSNGRGGFHLRTLFSEPVPTPTVYAFLRWLTRDHVTYGLRVPPEQFPKQPAIKPGGYGNWLRLPGRHHTREHWSKVWNGSSWLEGEQAVRFILSLQGDDPALIPSNLSVVTRRPETPRRRIITNEVAGTENLARRITGYLSRLPNLGEGQGRDNVAYHLACWLVRDLQLPDETALVWLQCWDDQNTPPKGELRLREILASAHRYGRNAYGCGLQTFILRGSAHHRYLRFQIEV
jgi:hypothetical protein